MKEIINDNLSVIITALVGITGIVITYLSISTNNRLDIKKQRHEYLSRIFFPLITQLNILQQLLSQKKKNLDKANMSANKNSIEGAYQCILNLLTPEYHYCGYFLHRRLTALYLHITNYNYIQENKFNEETLRRKKNNYPLPWIWLTIALLKHYVR